MAKKIPRDVQRLACEFSRDVAARAAVGDQHAAYHAQRPKNTAYRQLLAAGYTVKQSVSAFARLVRRCGKR